MSCCGCHAFANVARKAQVGRQETLVDQLAAFGALGAGMVRDAAAAQVSAAEPNEAWEDRWLRWNEAADRGEQMWSAAFQLVEALLQGAAEHVPEAIHRVELREGALHVQLSCGELLGEFATRSRMGAQIRLEEQVEGLDFPALPGAVQLREELVETLGPRFSRSTAFECWQQRKDLEFPLSSSKLRRVHESLAQYPLPSYVAEKALWGYLNAPPGGCSGVRSLEFHQEGDGIRVSAHRRQPTCDSLRQQLAIIDELCVEVLLQDRFLGEQFAPSSMNFLAMTHGHAAGQHGADPKKIAKLMSAAKNWGPGKDGWYQFDETWTCVDQKDWLGRTLEEQGRIVWHKPGFQLT
ncbi:unnamed protein product [Effrenium voratum]|uniref:Uncharacterized protein n=1 Tax=Effrenium voratum TaxID=2562239 RepID=A0AA36JFY5_9DINO|nr:unnamed protein product [Effrenium voratum]